MGMYDGGCKVETLSQWEHVRLLLWVYEIYHTMMMVGMIVFFIIFKNNVFAKLW